MKVKKFLSLILALMLIASLFAACTDNDTPTESPSETATDTPEEPSESEEPSLAVDVPLEDTAEPSADMSKEATPDQPKSTGQINPNPIYTPVSLPISDEQLTYTMFSGMSPDASPYIDDPLEDVAVLKELCEITNITFDITLVSMFAEQEQLNLMLASGDLKDIICGLEFTYSKTGDQAIEDEVAIDLTPLIDEYAPNYRAALYRDAESVIRAQTTNGAMIAFASLYLDNQSPTQGGPVIRQDWLDELGLEAPRTVDELYEALKAFKDNYGAKMFLGYRGSSNLIYAFGISGYDARSNQAAAYVKGGTVYSGLMQDEFVEYLKYMNKLYKYGIIDSEFYASTSDMFNAEFGRAATGEFGFGWISASDLEYLNILCEGNAHWVALPEFLLDESDGVVHFGSSSTYFNKGTWTITPTCPDPENIVKFVDYIYSEEGQLLTNYGFEGLTFEYDETGTPQLTDLILNNPDGLPITKAQLLYTSDVQSMYPLLFDIRNTTVNFTEDQFAAMDIWRSSTDGSRDMPVGATMTLEESEAAATVTSDMSTYLEEKIISYIIGKDEIGDLSDFREMLVGFGIEQLIDINQSKYDRYIERLNALLQ